MQGLGIEKWNDGSTYVGQYRHGKMNGKGKIVWADRSCYNGEFVNNNWHG